MDLVTFHSWLTVAMFIAFVALIVWAWSGRRRRAFDEAARLPLEDDDAVPGQPNAEKKHG